VCVVVRVCEGVMWVFAVGVRGVVSGCVGGGGCCVGGWCGGICGGGGGDRK